MNPPITPPTFKATRLAPHQFHADAVRVKLNNISKPYTVAFKKAVRMSQYEPEISFQRHKTREQAMAHAEEVVVNGAEWSFVEERTDFQPASGDWNKFTARQEIIVKFVRGSVVE